MTSFVDKLTRKKYFDKDNITDTKLSRCLTTLDLTALGIGSTLGAGIYVVAGQVAMETAGPSVILSFLIAAAASVLAGLCYAEFGARVPKTGSAYVYSYVTVGELIAFIIGWNLILEYVIGTASVARAWSTYFDSLINKTIQNFFHDNLPMDVTGLSPYPDFFAFGITLFLTCILAVGVKESSRFNNIFTAVNLVVVAFVVICGLFKSDIKNWKLSANDTKISNSTVAVGDGGFFPFGFSGMMSGAATCFYAFVGFDCIATTGEEVQNPQKAIPISIVLSLVACFLAYFGVSAVLTLMAPYFILDHDAPLPGVFQYVGWEWARYAIAVGAVCGLSTSLLGAMFPLPRIIYAMASDGLLFKCLSIISKRFHTPLLGTVISGLLAGLMAMLFDLKELVDMMSIGTLLAYTVVAFCVLLLRYQVNTLDERGNTEDHTNHEATSENQNYIRQMFSRNSESPSPRTELIAAKNITVICILIIFKSVVLIFLSNQLSEGEWWTIIMVFILVFVILILLISTWLQPQNKDEINFKVPGLPFLPIISIFVNIYLMLKLPPATWIRFGVWMIIGFILYFTYGIRNSVEGNYDSYDEHIPLTATSTLILDDDSDDFIEEYHDDDDDNDQSNLIWMKTNSENN